MKTFDELTGRARERPPIPRSPNVKERRSDEQQEAYFYLLAVKMAVRYATMPIDSGFAVKVPSSALIFIKCHLISSDGIFS